jgi:hypothetical protein
VSPRRRARQEPAFILEDGDLFYCILVSEGVRYESDPDAETVLTFFVVRRTNGTHDIVNVSKTFKGEACVSRTVQKKQGIPAGRIEDEVEAIERTFSKGIEDATGYRIRWYRLDLAQTKDRATQVAAIAHWGRVGVKADAGGGICLN